MYYKAWGRDQLKINCIPNSEKKITIIIFFKWLNYFYNEIY